MAHRNFVDLRDLCLADAEAILDCAVLLKRDPWQDFLHNKHVAMIFEKNSTRTRFSFEVGISQLGGRSIYIDAAKSHIGTKESFHDSAKVMSRFVDLIMMRANHHEHLLELSEHSEVPVINGLTDFNHPCQILADIFTYREHRGPISGKKVAWLGDVNNVARSFIHAAFLFGFELHVAAPPQFQMSRELQDWCAGQERAGLAGKIVPHVSEDGPVRAAEQADLVVTDTWVSMGDRQPEERCRALGPYQVNAGLMSRAKSDALFMHCLPAVRGKEVTDEVIDGPHSVVFDEAENRLHVQKAVILWLFSLDQEIGK